MTTPNIYALDRWLDTMRSSAGYGGPVAHWWEQSLMFGGAGFDWRYEGIITGYLALWRRTGAERWLTKAKRAGNDLVNAQHLDGHFPNSSFERNPATAGTPHEAACCVALLRLAAEIQHTDAEGAERFLQCAETNLQRFYIDQLWDAQRQWFSDGVGTNTFVPNKAATACEAFFLWAKLRQREEYIERYVLPNLDHILDHQISASGQLRGAIAQNSLNSRRVAKFFPLYIARCVPALLQGYVWTGDVRFQDAALNALAFIVRWLPLNGNLPTVIYADGSFVVEPCWVAALGDILRVGQLTNYAAELTPLRQRFLAGQDDSGAFQTATGFAGQVGKRRSALPDVRDVLHVVGWNDKALRYLAEYEELGKESVIAREFFVDCALRNRPMRLHESAEQLTITSANKLVYQWHKGNDRPTIADPLFWLR